MEKSNTYTRIDNKITIKKDEFKKLSAKDQLSLILLTSKGRNLFRRAINKMYNVSLEEEPWFETWISLNEDYCFLISDQNGTKERVSVCDLPFALVPYELKNELHDIVKGIVGKKENQFIVKEAISELKHTEIKKANFRQDMEMGR